MNLEKLILYRPSQKVITNTGWYFLFFIIAIIFATLTTDGKFNKDAPVEHFRVVNIYESFDRVIIPKESFKGVAKTDSGMVVEVEYTFFDDNQVKKSINKIFPDGTNDYIEDSTRYDIKGSVIYFKDTGNQVFSLYPRPIKFNMARGTMNFFGSGKLKQYYLVKK